METKIPAVVVALVVVSAVGVTGVSAQEVETEIQFEDEVVAGEETTITYVANVIETPMETTVETELTLLVDGEEVQSVTSEEEVFEGAELRTEFNHTFESAGEKEITVESVTEALGQEITDSTTATVTVEAADDDGGENGMDDGNQTEDGTDGGMDDSTSDGGDTDGEGDDSQDGMDNTDDGMDDETDGGTEDETDGSQDDTGEGLPGFGVVVALVSLAAVAVYTSRVKRS